MKILILTFLFFSHLSFAKNKFVVLIDPGHGGEDQGTAHHGVLEKDITLGVGKNLLELLKQDPHFDPHITRTSDIFIEIDDRMKKAEQLKVDAFISIHANSSSLQHARGIEIYFESQIPTDEDALLTANRENNIKKSNSATTENVQTTSDVKSILTDLKRSNHMVTSQILAKSILESMQTEFKSKSKSTLRQGPFRVLTVTLPSTLIEMGYISNQKEALWLKNTETQQKMAQAMYKGLVDFKKKLDKQKK